MPYYQYICIKCDKKIIVERTPDKAFDFPVCEKCKTSENVKRIYFPAPKLSDDPKTYRG